MNLMKENVSVELGFILSQCQTPKIGEYHALLYSFSCKYVSKIQNQIPYCTAEINFLSRSKSGRLLTVTPRENKFWLCNQESGFEN